MVPEESYVIIRVFNFSNINHVARYEHYENDPKVHMEEISKTFDQFGRFSIAYKITLPERPGEDAYDEVNDDPFDNGSTSLLGGN